MMTVKTNPDGLHLPANAPLQQLMADDSLRGFADGLLPRVVAATLPAGEHVCPFTELLHSQSPAFGGVLAALLALDAEVIATVDGDRRVWPLSGFLSYRSRLAIYPPEIVRLPPLNPDSHYLLTGEPDRVLVLRFDLHPQLRVLGHVRLAVAGKKLPPQRLMAIEHRLERRTLTHQLLGEIKIAGNSTGDLAIDPNILKQLLSLLQEFAGENG